MTLALFGLSLANCSKESSSQRPALSDSTNPNTSETPAKPKLKFVVELDATTDLKPSAGDGVQMVEGFKTPDKAYAIYEAEGADVLAKYLERTGMSVKKFVEVRDINSPTRGGGQAAQKQPREGHKTFVIERKIPGVGSFPDEKKQAISKKANAAVAELGAAIEWDHSYLTDEGTYCVYRATDEEMIRKHAAAAGAPVNKVSVAQTVISPQ